MSGSERVRFGIFEFNFATGELYRDGVSLHLQAQPAQVLALLVAHAGEVVTREALRNAVWGSETFVDFDRGLNFCIAQIRGALGDSAESPRFVRTLPKRGYQFIAPVARLGQGHIPEPDTDLTAVAAVPSVRRFTKSRLLIAASLTLAVGLLAFWGLRTRFIDQQASAPQTIRVAVARFDNETGNADFDRFADGLTDSVVAELTVSGAGHYGVIGNAAILRVPRNQRDLVAIASSLDASYVILAQIRRNSSQFFVLAHLIHLPDQTHLAVTQLDCPANDPLNAQSELARRIVTEFSRRLVPQNKVQAASPSSVSH